jgi:hypothetical protein
VCACAERPRRDYNAQRKEKRITQRLISGEAIIHPKEEAYFLKKQRDYFTAQACTHTHAHKMHDGDRGFSHKFYFADRLFRVWR